MSKKTSEAVPVENPDLLPMNTSRPEVPEKYQHMTTLPEELERALLKVPFAVLLKYCGWGGASTKYSCVKHLWLTKSENQLKALADSNWSAEQLAEAEAINEAVRRRDARPAQEAPAESTNKKAPKEPKAPKAPRAAVADTTLVTLLKGKTQLQAGGMRDQLVKALEKAGGKATMAELSAALPQMNVKSVVGKLAEVQWVKVGGDK